MNYLMKGNFIPLIKEAVRKSTLATLKTVLLFHGIFKKIISLPVIFYRKFISHLKITPSCRFTPSCSKYALDALEEWGVIIGISLTLWRIIRCNPFSKGGYDPVPKNKLKEKLKSNLKIINETEKEKKKKRKYPPEE